MLSKEQQKLVEDNLWVVNTALQKQGLSMQEDLKQDAILYMCKCVMRFDSTKNVKFTTYAYRNVYLYIKRTHAKNCKEKARFVDEDVFDLVEKPRAEPSKTAIDELEDFNDFCEDDEIEILELKRQGYKVAEISQKTGISKNMISTKMRNIRDKASEL